ncbi:MAG: STAS domain-containing protein [Chloroflexi bacterium]|nr:STAS domain-containing protein [Chloroflexota bacterium]
MTPSTHRTVVLSLFGLLTLGSCVALVTTLLLPNPDPAALAVMSSAIVANLLLLGLYGRGWEPARYLYLLFTTILVGSVPHITNDQWFYVVLPPAIAAVLAGPGWTVGTAVLGYLLILMHSGGEGPGTSLAAAIFLSLIVGTISIGQWLTSVAQRTSEQHAEAAREAQARAEAQAAELAFASEQQAIQLDQQRRLLELVATLETPAIQLADGVFIAPLTGQFDQDRLHRLMSQLLETAHSQRAKLIILDLAGVPALDSAIAHGLREVVQALRLLGCTVMLSSLSSVAAQSLSQEGWLATEVVTVRSPQEALERYHLLHRSSGANGAVASATQPEHPAWSVRL